MDQSAAIAQFNSVTGNADQQLAVKFLEVCAGDVSRAAELYFEEMDAGHGASQPSQPASSTKPVVPVAAAPSSRPKPQQSSGGIRSLSDIKKDDADDDDRESYYAGGSEKSGVQIQDPRKKGPQGAELVQQVFDNAKKMGAQQTDEMEVEKEKFGGSGFRLGNDSSRPGEKIEAPKKPQTVTKVITFYKQGFTVNDGPLRRFEDPENSKFLEDVNQGYVPRELEEEAQGGAVHVDLVDKKNEDFKEPPKPKVVAFSGHGQSLGGSSSAPLITTPAPAREIVVDASKPVTSIQIRTADGARLIGKFNHDHTILDIRSWLESQKKPTGPYDLITTLPARTLSDLNQTIKDAGLLNAAINQKNR